MADPWGRALEWAALPAGELTRRLDDPRFAVRDRAASQLARRGETALAALRDALRDGSPKARLGASWVLARVAGDGARAATRDALRDGDQGVRLASAAAAGLHRDGQALDRLREMVRSDAPPVRREAATALGRIASADAVPALLEGLRDGPDRVLEHALIFALIQIGNRDGTLAGLRDASPAVRRGA